MNEEYKDPLQIFLETNLGNPDFNNWVLYTLRDRAEAVLESHRPDDHGLTRDRIGYVKEFLDEIIKSITDTAHYDWSRLARYLKDGKI